jgi:hypothetical protein
MVQIATYQPSDGTEDEEADKVPTKTVYTTELSSMDR